MNGSKVPEEEEHLSDHHCKKFTLETLNDRTNLLSRHKLCLHNMETVKESKRIDDVTLHAQPEKLENILEKARP